MVNVGSPRRKLRQHSRGLRSRSRSSSPSPSPPTPPHTPTDTVTSTSDRTTPKAPPTQPTPHQPDPVDISSSRKPSARVAANAEPMDHSGRTSPELLLSNPNNPAPSVTVDGIQETDSNSMPLERPQSNKTTEQVPTEGPKEDGSVKAGQVSLLKQAEKRRSPSPNEHLGLPVKRQLSTDQPPRSSKRTKPLPSTSLHGPLSRLGLKTEGSSASKVLTEEFQKQQGQENAKVKASILKEIRKPGKSESMGTIDNTITFVCDEDIVKSAVLMQSSVRYGRPTLLMDSWLGK